MLILLNSKSLSDVVRAVIENDGFNVIGWFKPPRTVSDSFVEIHSFHIVRLYPVKDVSDLLKRYQYCSATEQLQSSEKVTPLGSPSTSGIGNLQIPSQMYADDFGVPQSSAEGLQIPGSNSRTYTLNINDCNEVQSGMSMNDFIIRTSQQPVQELSGIGLSFDNEDHFPRHSPFESPQKMNISVLMSGRMTNSQLTTPF